MPGTAAVAMSDCNETISLLDRPTFTCLLIAELIIGLLGSLTNLCLLVALWKTRLFHNNLRILLTHASIVAAWYSLVMSAKATRILVKWKTDPCSLVSTLYHCKLSEMVAILPLLTLAYSLVPIGLERMYATLRYRKYERLRNIGLSIVLIILTWTCSLTVQLYPLSAIPRNETAPFCVSLLSMTNSAAVWMLVVGAVQELAALVLYMATYLINKTLYVKLLINRASDQTLTSRFQLAQNIQVSQQASVGTHRGSQTSLLQVSELMLPTAAAHAAFMLPANGLAVLVVAGLNIDFVRRVELVHGGHLSALLYSFVHPIICFVRNAALRRAIMTLLTPPKEEGGSDSKRISQKRRYTNDYELTGVASESEKHFDILLKTWENTGK